jgi:hypothetical protein
MMRRGTFLLLLAAAALGVTTAARLPAAWASGNALNHVSGAWMALAEDLAHGQFYRPILDPELGYGGTRWFPLAFAAHAALRVAGLDLVTAGYALARDRPPAGGGRLRPAPPRGRCPGWRRRSPCSRSGPSRRSTHCRPSATTSCAVALGALGLAALARGPSRRAIAGRVPSRRVRAAKPTGSPRRRRRSRVCSSAARARGARAERPRRGPGRRGGG